MPFTCQVKSLPFAGPPKRPGALAFLSYIPSNSESVASLQSSTRQAGDYGSTSPHLSSSRLYRCPFPPTSDPWTASPARGLYHSPKIERRQSRRQQIEKSKQPGTLPYFSRLSSRVILVLAGRRRPSILPENGVFTKFTRSETRQRELSQNVTFREFGSTNIPYCR